MLSKSCRIAAFIVLMLGFLVLSQHTKAQNVTLKGKTFIASKDSSRKSQSVKTDYVYVDTDNVSYPVYLSKNGKAYILRTSKKTGKEYRKYLPEITKMFQEMDNNGKSK